jgi:hypothetical protein
MKASTTTISPFACARVGCHRAFGLEQQPGGAEQKSLTQILRRRRRQ